MTVNKNSKRLREMIEKAIEDLVVTRAEYDKIHFIAGEDGVVDPQEQALLSQLQDMIENNVVKLIP